MITEEEIINLFLKEMDDPPAYCGNGINHLFNVYLKAIIGEISPAEEFQAVIRGKFPRKNSIWEEEDNINYRLFVWNYRNNKRLLKEEAGFSRWE